MVILHNLGGNFNYVGPNTGNGVKLNRLSDFHNINYPKVDGEI
ncbi:MAG TPA: hypothetical protein PLI27_05370 [Ignavibacteriales bacterium]|nr:hypothetical protein [Ignavibacteriales bacterium]HOL81918.1 hypothetical protein [Ignavibacteriales bacterium]HOM65958.1 hypothetical protein [Ignavibacteriales bacterium]HPD67490.1 hypothetical protein [Ignavibacteriales bacterium]HPP34055.1 hypothetical protein [Ignavibacteriales bacterium]